MKGINFTVPGADYPASNPTLKTLDAIESNGSLLLADVAHPLGQFDGVLGNGDQIPNIVAPIASSLIGAPEQDLHLTCRASTQETGVFEVERTAAGGVHGMSTKGGGQASSRIWAVSLSNTSDMYNYIKQNIAGHKFYVSLYYMLTRQSSSTGAPQSLSHFANSTSDYSWFVNSIGVNNKAGQDDFTPSDFSHSSAASVGKPALISLETDGITAASVNGNPLFALAMLGAGDAWAGFNYNKAPSGIFYRAYMEDLTISGRTYEEVQAIDKQIFDIYFGENGVLHNDSYSDPVIAVP